MSPDVEREYKDALRQLMRKAYPLLPEEQRSVYMSTDYAKARHIIGDLDDADSCEWDIVPGLEVLEENHYEFAGTDASNDLVTKLIASGVNCKCGALTDETIFVHASFSEVLEQIIGVDGAKKETL